MRPLMMIVVVLFLVAPLFAQSSQDVVLVADTGSSIAWDAACTRRVEWVDYDADGDLDYFALNYGTPNVVYGNRGGRFSRDLRLNNDLMLPSLAKGIGFGDLDGDGDVDAVVANGNLRPNHVLLNQSMRPVNRPGMFVVLPASGIEGEQKDSYDAALGDLDGDGVLDLVVINRFAPCDLYMGVGDGHFTPNLTTRISSIVGGGRDVDLADLDGDGDLDVLMVFSGHKENLCIVNLGGDQGGVEGEFAVTSLDHTSVRPSVSYGVAVGDLDCDGDLDVAVANRNEPNTLQRNVSARGVVRFVRAGGTVVDRDLENSYDVAIGDLEGDGDPDLVFANGKGQDNALYLATRVDPINDGAGYLRLTGSQVTKDDGDSRAVALADVFAYPDPVTGAAVRGALELAVGNSSDDVNMLYRGYGPQWFELDAYPRPFDRNPSLTGHGVTVPGDTVMLMLAQGVPFAPAALAIGFVPTALPFKGGVLLVDPSRGLGVLQFVSPFDENGCWSLRVALPARLPRGFEMGLAVYFQMLSADRFSPGGVELSNGLRMRFTQ